MTRIVAIGECMVEMAPTDTPDQFKLGFAGDTLNTAWYLRKALGADDQVGYFTAVGTDAMSDRMLAFLATSGLETDRILRRTDRTVGLYLIQLDKGERSFAYWRGQSAAKTLAQDAGELAAALAGADMVFLSGISVAVLPPEDRTRLIAALERFDGQVVFDPNLRPRLWTSSEEMTAAITRAAEVADIVLPSFEDEADWFGDASPQATAARYASGGAKHVIVKNGPGDILIWSDGAEQVVPVTPSDQVVDTTAAGDSFNAGFLAAYLAGQDLAKAASAGAALSRQVIARYGALVDLA